MTISQREAALKLMHKYKKDQVWVKLTNGHMYFSETCAKVGYTQAQFEEKFACLKLADLKLPEANTSTGEGLGDDDKDKVVVIPDAEPSESWTKDELIAFGAREYPDLRLTKSMKESTILSYLADAKIASEADEVSAGDDDTDKDLNN